MVRKVRSNKQAYLLAKVSIRITVKTLQNLTKPKVQNHVLGGLVTPCQQCLPPWQSLTFSMLWLVFVVPMLVGECWSRTKRLWLVVITLYRRCGFALSSEPFRLLADFIGL